MTIRLLCAYNKYPANAIVTLDSATEAGLVAAKMASTNTAGGVPYVLPTLPNQLSRAQILKDGSGNLLGLADTNGNRVDVGTTAATITGTFAIGQTITATLPAGVVGTLQFTRSTIPVPPALPVKSNIAGAVANAVNSLSYKIQDADGGFAVDVDVSNTSSTSKGGSVPFIVASVASIAPAGGGAGLASNQFAVTLSPLGAPLTAPVTVTPSDGGAGGTFAPASLMFTSVGQRLSFIYTPASAGAKVISFSNNGGLANPAPWNYTATASTDGTIFTESFANLSAWTQGATPLQVSGGRAYSGGSSATSNMNHAFACPAGTNMRAVFPVNIAASSTSGGLAIAVNQDAAGAAPSSGAVGDYAMYFDFSGNKVAVITPATGQQTTIDATLVRGSYIVTVTVDALYISIYAAKTDGLKEYFCRRLRAGFNVNNLQVFLGDPQLLSGSSIGPMSARKGLQSITPRTFGEGAAITANYSGNATQGAGYLLSFPVAFDNSTGQKYPLAILFHGDTGSELSGVTDAPYRVLRLALLAAGYIVLSVGTTNTSTWGADVSTDAYFEAWQYVNDNYNISATVFVAGSMGGIESLNTLAREKIPGVVAWVGYSPTADLALAYATSWTAKINTAYGISSGSPYAVATADHDPRLMAASRFRSLPMMFMASTFDSLVPKAQNTDPFAAQVASTAKEVIVIPDSQTGQPLGGHGFDPTPYMSQMVTFLNKYVAGV